MIKDFLTTQATNVQTAAVNISAQSFDPGVTVQSDAPFLEPLRTAAGWGMALGLVFVVIIVVVGGVLIATGKVTNTPGNQSKGFMVVLFSLIGAAVIAGASAVVFFGTTIGMGA
ncbi:hypothetical protein EDL96_12795 [Kocuria soli]|uniref:Integral membrane protein n=1 Tax=Kocuria soli TaxID=2485125 RepID=A0A3N4A862_9MICC|nr:hypothetical protein [Kocuria soli]ROZ61628.1 hypothetical protein EDL96_12795 [Kocuria soli]